MKGRLSTKNHAQELLQKASFEQQWFLANLCKELICESTMGYTLVGDKPISNTTLRGQIINRKYFFRTTALPLIRKYESMLRSTNFVLLLDKNPTEIYLYLVNKKAFLNATRQNIHIFRSILGETTTPTGLLDTIISKKCTIETALKGSHVLFGILFGFGTENAMRFARRQQLEDSEYQLGMPPWKEPRILSSMKLEDWVLFHMNRKNCIEKIGKPAIVQKISPTPPFSSIQEELTGLDKSLSFSCDNECPPGHLLPIELPGFMGDPDSEETQKMFEKYKIQRTFLTKLIADENFLPKVLEIFYKTDER
jgi:hypothetical protein